MTFSTRLFAAALAACSAAPACAAEDPAADPLTIDARIDLVSDYRWRGLSLSGGEPALQGTVELAHASGLYVSAWATTLPNSLGDAEVDLAAGWSFEAAGTAFSVGGVAYLYPSLADADYGELAASVGRTVGPVELTAAVAYAPDQRNIARDDLYLSADAALPFGETGFAATAHLGRERGPFNLTRAKWDWSAGVSYAWRGIGVSATYVDTDEPAVLDPEDIAGAGVVAALSFSF